MFEHLQLAQIIRMRIEAMSLDSTIVKVHPDVQVRKKNGPQAIGKSRGGWSTKIHMVAANARTAIAFTLSAGQAHDAPEGRQLLLQLCAGRSSRQRLSWIERTRVTRHDSWL